MPHPPKVPAVTEQEVLEELRWGVFSAGELATKIWHERGGEGSPAEATRFRRQPKVPVVRAAHVTPVLAVLADRGAVVSKVGDAANALGSPMKGFREKVAYFATADNAREFREREAAEAEQTAAAAALAERLGSALGSTVEQVKEWGPGRVMIVVTVAQAGELFADQLTEPDAPAAKHTS